MTNAGTLFIDEVVRDEIEMDETAEATVSRLREAGYALRVEEHPDSPSFTHHTHDIDYPERGRVLLYAESGRGDRDIYVGDAAFTVEHTIERGWENHVVAHPAHLLIIWRDEVVDALCSS